MFDAPPQAEVGSAEDCYLNESDRHASFMIFLRMSKRASATTRKVVD